MSKLSAGVFAVLTALFSLWPQSPAAEITFMPQWVPQSQFAGFYLAESKGFFAEEGLNIRIRHISENQSEDTTRCAENGQADIVGCMLENALEARERGLRLVNIMQVLQGNGLACVSRKPLRTAEDLNGLRVAWWKSLNPVYPLVISRERAPQAEWIEAVNGNNLYIYKAVDAVMVYTYSELPRLRLSVGEIPQENILRFSADGWNIPEDGLYVTEAFYNAHRDELKAFVRACKRGWEYARKHPDEALIATEQYRREAHLATNRVFQRMMLEEYLRLQVNPATQRADFAPPAPEQFEQCVRVLQRMGLLHQPIRYEEVFRP